MKKVGNWYIPDSDLSKKSLINFVLKEEFQCKSALNNAFKHVKRFNNAIDIGTWIGDSTKIIANKFKNVKGFEASPKVYECCKMNLKAHNISNCEIVLTGLSNISGTQKFLNKGKTFSGWISTSDLKNKNFITIETCRLDDLNLTNIDFIKIDVDSHEGFLVEGAIEFFKKNSPVILIESKKKIHKERQRSNMPDPLVLLKKLNYKILSQEGKADYILAKVDK